MIYLDHAAATPLDPRVFKAMQPYLKEKYGNPSSVHQLGQEARAAVNKARLKLADFLHCLPTELYFTSSGTESCNWALLGLVEQRLLKGQQAHLIVSSIEHPAVLECARFLQKSYGIEISYLSVDQEGIVKLEALKELIKAETVLVSVMTVNNEIGTVQPIGDIGKLCREEGILFHSDACQAAGYLDLDLKELQVDLLSMNAGKIYGPKGVGVLYIKEGLNISPWTFGGGQEFGMRSGTENVAAIVGIGRAIELIDAQESEKIARLRDQLWELLRKKIKGLELNGTLKQRVPNNLHLHMAGVDAESLVRRLDLEGVAISMGSACAAGTVEPSHVILALGYDEQRARSSIRISLGRQNTVAEIETFVDHLINAVHALRAEK